MAKKWLEVIKENYKINDDIIESQTEYFLIVCRSINDYLINDVLGLIDPKMKNVVKADITDLKEKYTRFLPKQTCHKKILDFLDEHKNKIKDFEKDLLVKYFISLRNWTVHSIFPNIYENQYGDNNTIMTRHFQRDFVDYLELEQGGRLLLENGFPLELNGNNESIFDKYPLSKLTSDEKLELTKKLETEDPIKLMSEYVSKIDDIVEYFEKNY